MENLDLNCIWLNDLDEDSENSSDSKSSPDRSCDLVKENGSKGSTSVVAMDCEMVGVGPEGVDSILARVSIVNFYGHCLYDKYVRPTTKVTDYRTHVSGIRPEDIENGEDFNVVQREVENLLNNRILVGHSLGNDFSVLKFKHPKSLVRDTSVYQYFRSKAGVKNNPKLKVLAQVMLGINIQNGEHNSVQDAQAAMCLYFKYQLEWERDIRLGIEEAPKKKKKTGAKKSSSANNVPSNGLRVLGQNRITSNSPDLERITSIGSRQRFVMSQNCPRLSGSNNFATVGAFKTPDLG